MSTENYAFYGGKTELRVEKRFRTRHNHNFLCHALRSKSIAVESNLGFPVSFEGVSVNVGFRCDLVVQNQVIVEIKTVSEILPIHKAQLLTYMRLSGIQKGLLLNFNAVPFTSGIVRMVLTPLDA